MKINKKFWFLLFSFMLTSISANALEINCRWVYIEMSGEGGWRYDCDTVPDLPPDDVVDGRVPGSGSPGAGGAVMGVPVEKLVDLAKLYTPPCKEPNESQEVYVKRAVAGCIGFVIDNAYDSALGRLIARSLGVVGSLVLSPCTANINLALAEGRVQTCG
jgi:hypothetical protein